jgi:aminoglycoside/choline kinase family phosphotransferase
MGVGMEAGRRALSWARERLGVGGDWLAEPLASDASPRRYWRLAGKSGSVLVMAGPDLAENIRWLRLGQKLLANGHPLPRIFAHDLGLGLFALEDLGRDRLDGLGRAGADAGRLLSAYRHVAAILADWHDRARAGVGEACRLNQPYGPGFARRHEWDYFVSGLGLMGLSGFLSPGLSAEAGRLCQAAGSPGQAPVLIHRDFQSRNVMLARGGPRVIDWQGARLGPPLYDLASLVLDPYVDLGQEVRDGCVGAYLEASRSPAGRRGFGRRLAVAGLVRLMQATGAYARLWKVLGRPSYAAYVLPALSRMSGLLGTIGPKAFPLVSGLVNQAHAALAEAPCQP